ncbi:FAD-dependent oxidoreductase [uncultured Ferrimonas sp.]|uniref:NAD(P)/FAD-dependent oxidoreductase n=1 Tax=uncultured Ferrimonas sp. TaxID=432640 RepID=UPI002628465D|nr:FAD-dependent oxidoreductase [uncultured Ferrimonas sp.]
MKTQVLVIGGGFAGVAVAQKLAKQGIDTVLVDRKDYFEVTYAVLRDVADPKQNNGNARQYYQQLLTGRFIHSGVQQLSHNSAMLENGDSIHFEKVVIASGSSYPSLPLAKSSNAISIDARNQELHQYHQQLQTAKQVLIIGGGVVGVELAGEIAYAMPTTNVTLAHNGHALLDGFRSKAQAKALAQLQRLGVEVKFNARYQQQGEHYVDSNSGDVLRPDVAFAATGVRPNNQFLQQQFAHTLNPQGLVKVDKQLSVIGQDNFYALGDIADVGEAKLGYLALEQGNYLGKRISNQLKGKRSKGYSRHPFMALVPTGQETGVAQLPFITTTWRTLLNMKQKDLFISKTFNELSH